MKPDKILNNDMVIKSNSLVQASYELTTAEIRLIDIALTQLTEFDEQTKVIPILEGIQVTAEEYATFCNVDKRTAYDALSKASETLFSRKFSYEIESQKSKKTKKLMVSRWVSQVNYQHGLGAVELFFTPELVNLAGQLKNNFTRLHLVHKAPLTSQYAHRLYEMMLQWRSTTTVPTIRYIELRDIFGIAEDEYDRISNFKARVLDPAIKQINKYTDITLSYEQYKKGRVIEGFIFKFKFKEQARKKQKENNDIKDKNGDLFTIDGYSDAQLARITRSPLFMNDYASRVAPNSIQNQDMGAWTAHFVQELKKDASKFNKRSIKDYLDY